MSVCFSFTIITRVATMLKAATPTIMKRMTNMIFFMLSMDLKKISWSAVQSRTAKSLLPAKERAILRTV